MTGKTRQIAQEIRRRISSGHWPVGHRLPGRRHLAAEFGVSLPTLEAALAHLEAEGYLKTRSRSGTYASHPGQEKRPTRSWSSRRTIILVSSLHRKDEGADNHRHWTVTIGSTMERILLEQGFAVSNVDRWAGNRLIEWSELISIITKRSPCAVGVIGDTDPPAHSCAFLRQTKIPFCMVGGGSLNEPVAAVMCGGRFAGVMTVREILKRGWERVVFVSPFWADWVEDRWWGLQTAWRDAGRSPSAIQRLPDPPWPYEKLASRGGSIYGKPAASLAYRWLQNPLPRTALVAVNDLVAFSILDAAAAAHLQAGRDFGLIGFDDDPRARYLDLSTFRPPLEAMGQIAAELILQAIQGRPIPGQIHLFPEWIDRGSLGSS